MLPWGMLFLFTEKGNLPQAFSSVLKQTKASFADQVLALIYFIGFEAAVYFLLSFLLLDPAPVNPDPQAITIVRNWNAFIYFALLYVTLTVSTMLALTSALPRRHQPLVMRLFWLSWPALVLMLFLAFS